MVKLGVTRSLTWAIRINRNYKNSSSIRRELWLELAFGESGEVRKDWSVSGKMPPDIDPSFVVPPKAISTNPGADPLQCCGPSPLQQDGLTSTLWLCEAGKPLYALRNRVCGFIGTSTIMYPRSEGCVGREYEVTEAVSGAAEETHLTTTAGVISYSRDFAAEH